MSVNCNYCRRDISFVRNYSKLINRGNHYITCFKCCIDYLLSNHVMMDYIICSYIRHISPLMFDVIDDKPEGVARGIYHV